MLLIQKRLTFRHGSEITERQIAQTSLSTSQLQRQIWFHCLSWNRLSSSECDKHYAWKLFEISLDINRNKFLWKLLKNAANFGLPGNKSSSVSETFCWDVSFVILSLISEVFFLFKSSEIKGLKIQQIINLEIARKEETIITELSDKLK